MTVELEMLNEENGRLRRHIKTLEAELRKQDAAQAQAEDLRGVSDAQGQGSVPVSAHTTGESSGHPTMQDVLKPVAYLAWRDGKPCYEGDDAVCEDAVWPVDYDDDRTSMAVYLASPPDHTAAMRLALEALVENHYCNSTKIAVEKYYYAIAALEKELK